MLMDRRTAGSSSRWRRSGVRCARAARTCRPASSPRRPPSSRASRCSSGSVCGCRTAGTRTGRTRRTRGCPRKITWTLPEGFTAEPLQWPRPERISAPPLASYGYNEEVLLPVVVHPPASLAAGQPVRLARARGLARVQGDLPSRQGGADDRAPGRRRSGDALGRGAAFREDARHAAPDGAAWRPRALSVPKRVILAFSPSAAPREAYFFADQGAAHRVRWSRRSSCARPSDGSRWR